jgi:hypothetical protein
VTDEQRPETSLKPDFINGLGDSSRITADMAVLAVGNDSRLFKELIDLSFTQPYPTSMRTARVAQLCCESEPEMILPYIDEIIEKIAISKIDGVKRSYLKVINDHLGPEKIKEPGRLVQLCFNWIVSNAESVAVRYHCLGILEKLCRSIPELRSELREVVEMLLEEGSASAGLRNRLAKMV